MLNELHVLMIMCVCIWLILMWVFIAIDETNVYKDQKTKATKFIQNHYDSITGLVVISCLINFFFTGLVLIFLIGNKII